jgi:DNA-binding response OmpR family regulator
VAATLAETWPLLDREPDVLVLDLMLPDGDGVEVLRKVRREQIRVRVVVTTGSEDSTRLECVRTLGPDLFLTKPINLQELLNGVAPGA